MKSVTFRKQTIYYLAPGYKMVRLYKAITVIEKNQVFNPTTTPRVFFWMFHGQKQKLP